MYAVPLNDSPGMSNKKRHLLCGHLAGSDAQVTFVFPILVVHDNDKLSPSKRFQCIFERIKCKLGRRHYVGKMKRYLAVLDELCQPKSRLDGFYRSIGQTSRWAKVNENAC